MGKLKDEVREKLAGLDVRQTMRDAARRHACQVRAIHHVRRQGILDDLREAEDYLTNVGVTWTSETYYGIVLVYAAGVTLAYRPDGTLDWVSAQKVKDDMTQYELIDDSCGVIYVS
jgi:hypothetical protein